MRGTGGMELNTSVNRLNVNPRNTPTADIPPAIAPRVLGRRSPGPLMSVPGFTPQRKLQRTIPQQGNAQVRSVLKIEEWWLSHRWKVRLADVKFLKECCVKIQEFWRSRRKLKQEIQKPKKPYVELKSFEDQENCKTNMRLRNSMLPTLLPNEEHTQEHDDATPLEPIINHDDIVIPTVAKALLAGNFRPPSPPARIVRPAVSRNKFLRSRTSEAQDSVVSSVRKSSAQPTTIKATIPLKKNHDRETEGEFFAAMDARIEKLKSLGDSLLKKQSIRR